MSSWNVIHAHLSAVLIHRCPSIIPRILFPTVTAEKYVRDVTVGRKRRDWNDSLTGETENNITFWTTPTILLRRGSIFLCNFMLPHVLAPRPGTPVAYPFYHTQHSSDYNTFYAFRYFQRQFGIAARRGLFPWMSVHSDETTGGGGRHGKSGIEVDS